MLTLAVRQESSLKAWYTFRNVFKRQRQLVMHKEWDALYIGSRPYMSFCTNLKKQQKNTTLLNIKLLLTLICLQGFNLGVLCYSVTFVCWFKSLMLAHLNFQWPELLKTPWIKFGIMLTQGIQMLSLFFIDPILMFLVKRSSCQSIMEDSPS